MVRIHSPRPSKPPNHYQPECATLTSSSREFLAIAPVVPEPSAFVLFSTVLTWSDQVSVSKTH